MSDKIKKQIDMLSRRWMQASLIILAAVYSFNSILLSYLKIELSSDVLYSDTVLPTILDYIREFAELVAIAVCYAVMICVLYRCGKQRIKPIFALFISATAYKYLANTVVTWLASGSIPSSWALNLVNVIYYTLLEFLQLFIIYIIICPIIERFRSEKALAEKRLELLDEGEGMAMPKVYPFERIYDKKNCLCRSAFFCSLVIFIAKLLGDIISDSWMIIVGGLPTEWVTWVLMAVNYISKFIFALIAYFVIYIAISSMLKSSDKV